MDKALASNLIRRINVGDSLTRTAERMPQQLAVVDGTRRWTYRELECNTNRFAHGLTARGYGHGDVLALASGNSIEFLVTYFACAKIGVVCVPLNLGWGAKEIGYALGHSRARGIVVEAQLAPLVGPALASLTGLKDVIIAPGTVPRLPDRICERSALAFADVYAVEESAPEVLVGDRDAISYLYTSGTTSAPKGVVASHVAIYIEALTVAVETGLGRGERIACLMPLFHTAQLNGFATPSVMTGATQFLMRGFDPKALLDLIEGEHITRTFLLPMMWRALVADPSLPQRDLSSLHDAAYAMTPMPDALLKQCLATFKCNFYLAFGQTEMSPITTIFRPEHQLSHAGAVGTGIVNVQIGIMDERGKLLARGQEGEIVYRGPHALEGYLRNEEATDAVFAGGWFHSGDTGRLAEDGMLWFTDRYKDVVKSGGENVASIEVEKAIYATEPRVAEVVVVGLPHPHWIEAITAVVTLKPGETLDGDELIGRLKQQLASFKVPKAIIVVDAIAKTATGKLRKNVVRQQFADYYTKAAPAAE
ncbi:MAG TPA: AMP-binding protein [Nevskiaceae bacterium]|nr:AMP-binding protein [Nevskiaceae bacterium]